MKEKTKKIVKGALIGCGAIGVGILAYKYHLLKKENLKLADELAVTNSKLLKLECVKDAVVRRSLEKDVFFKEMISDGLRHNSSLAAKHMADLRWLNAA